MTRYKRTNVRTTGQKKRKNQWITSQPVTPKNQSVKNQAQKKRDGTRGHKTRVKTTGLKRTGSYWFFAEQTRLDCYFQFFLPNS